MTAPAFPEVKTSLPKISSSKFDYNKHSGANYVFLYSSCSSHPFLKVEAGWKIVGYGQAPWPGSTNSFAVMFEKTENDDDFSEGDQIWHHFHPSWVETLFPIETINK